MRTNNPAWMTVTGACAAAMATALVMVPGRADACGGTFCDGLIPGPMPVDQTGENVIFVMGGDKAEVHIQISIDPNTNANQFAWMIPLTSVPDFAVGSQPFFDNVRNGTVPTYDLTFSFEQCEFDGATGGGSAATTSGDPTNGEGSDNGGETDTGPTVILQEQVGAFDVVVLTDTELAPIQMWLEDNGYNWDPNAGPILQQYLTEGNVIAALKLTTGADLKDVHPITLRYDGLETCFPLRLTRIAAAPDMDIRVFVLANERAAPTNYQHVLVNPLKIDWLTRAMNYKEVISNAVDADMAGGRAFVTEYAGTSTAVSQFGIHSNQWDDQAFVGLDPVQTVNVLNDQGLANCLNEFECAWNHPLVYGLLLEFLPPPDGVEPLQFYADLASFVNDIDEAKWNMGMEFSAALLERIIEPGLAAVDLLDTWPYLTRMYTTISPAEMMEDPIFHTNPDLAEVDNIRVANNYLLCNGDGVVTLPDDREVYVPGAFTWPDIPGEEWWEEEVQTIALKGAPMTLVNNTAAITKVLTEWNLSHGWPRVPGEDTGNVPTGDYTSGGSDASSDGPPLEGESGCGCRSQGGVHGLWLLLGLLGLRPRRRR